MKNFKNVKICKLQQVESSIGKADFQYTNQFKIIHKNLCYTPKHSSNQNVITKLKK